MPFIFLPHSFALWEAGRAAGGTQGTVSLSCWFSPQIQPCASRLPLLYPPCRPWSSSVGLRSAGSDFPLPMGVAAHQRGFVRRKRWQPACGSRINQGLSPSFPRSRCWWQGVPTRLCRPWCGGRPCRGRILGQPPCTAPKGGSNPGSAWWLLAKTDPSVCSVHGSSSSSLPATRGLCPP